MPVPVPAQTPWRTVLLATPCLASALLLSACNDPPPPEVAASVASSGTSVLGAATAPRPVPPAPALLDTQGKPLPEPPVPRGAQAQAVHSGPDSALVVWVHEGTVMASTYRDGQGWGAGQVLEDIRGDARDVQLASNGQGIAIALWQHTVGNIQSLRFSRYDAATGWNSPDVMPGALPRSPTLAPPSGRVPTGPPVLRMDAQGNADAHWPSGFDENEVQSSRFVVGQGWSRATADAVAAAGRTP